MTTNFAFYGRVSTEDQQDPESSRAWQLSRSLALIEPHGGQVTAEFFDIGLSRSLPWKRRPQAAALLEAFRDPHRGFVAVVVGEPARAFYGNQFGLTFPVFVHYGVQLWVPEVGGQVDPGSDAHDLVMAMYGGMSKGERNRIKIRVRTAMASQAAAQGRFLGGRPPYGYRLADAGPHPNPGKAAAGQRCHRLEVDADTAPVVRRIFAEFLTGRGVSAVANRLNADAIPCPSANDPARNRHRSGAAWMGSAVQAILRNPRYTGYEVWNKQRKDEVLIDVDDVALGHQTRMRWNPTTAWIYSPEPVHPPLVEREQFDQAQALLAVPARVTSRATATGVGECREVERRLRSGGRHYLLRGLIFCGTCGRRMAGSWNTDRAHYRCKLTAADGDLLASGHPASIYVREDRIVDRLDTWLGDLLGSQKRTATIDALYDAGDDPATVARRRALQAGLRSCQDRLDSYRRALEAGADPAVVTGWIAEVTAERTRHEIDLARLAGRTRLTRDQITALVDQLAGLAAILRHADPRDRAEIYRQLQLRLTYQQERKIIVAELDQTGHGGNSGVRGGT